VNHLLSISAALLLALCVWHRVALLRARVLCVAAANKHSAAVTTAGELFTWGGNALGQLGYGSPDCSSNPTPRLVEALKGRQLVAVAAAKRHTGGANCSHVRNNEKGHSAFQDSVSRSPCQELKDKTNKNMKSYPFVFFLKSYPFV
jgi:alpha-tubulin suppressor-like RCC1 family protein